MMKQKILLFLSIVLVFLFSACGKKDSRYLTSGTWALYDSCYMFAVETENFNGDVFKSGKYEFKLQSGKTSTKLPAIFDVYIDDKLYNNIAETKQALSQPTFSVGGIATTNQSIECELLPGQYVYVIPYSVAYEPSGYLSFKFIK